MEKNDYYGKLGGQWCADAENSPDAAPHRQKRPRSEEEVVRGSQKRINDSFVCALYNYGFIAANFFLL